MITEVLLPVCVAGIMLVLGLSLTPDDFRRVVATPRGVGIGLGNLLVISPLLAFAIAELTGLAPELAVGLVLLGASPGGAMANMLTHLARGEVALSVTMTAVSSIMALVTVPLYLGLAIDHFGADLSDDFGMASIVARVFLITVVPLSIGMTVRHLRAAWVEANYETARRLALALLGPGDSRGRGQRGRPDLREHRRSRGWPRCCSTWPPWRSASASRGWPA